jgi:ATP-binding cassette subfamily B protein
MSARKTGGPAVGKSGPAVGKGGPAAGMIRTLSNIAFLLRYGWKTAPVFMASAFLYPVFQNVLMFFEHTYSVKFFIDSIQYDRPFAPVLYYICAIIALVSLNLAFGAFYNHYWKPKTLERVYATMRVAFYEKAGAVDLECYDDPRYYNDFVWVLNQAPERFRTTLDETCSIIGAIAAVSCAGVFIVLTDPVGLAFVAFSVVATTLAESKLGKLKYALDRARSPGQRKQAYVSRVFYTAEAAKEIRLTPVAGLLCGEFDGAGAQIEAAVKKHAPAQVRFGILSDLMFQHMPQEFFYTAWIIFRVLVLHNLSFGDTVALMGSSNRMKNKLENIATLAAEYATASLFVEKVRVFLGRSARIAVPSAPKPLPAGLWDISLRNVSFAYPGSELKIIDGVSLEIPGGRSLALVGHNGAGKTTLVKLLMRLYDPTEGAIFVNGIDIREFDPAEYRARIGVIFQDFQIFAASVAENVAMDRVCPIDERIPSIARSLRQSGFAGRLGGMKNGLSTQLTREFDEAGENLSGGEAQKLAIARVVSKNSSLAILDEPSSALDPISEYQLNETMRDAADKSTVVYISHRLSTTRLAGYVCLLENGSVVERGTHDELMGMRGEYARMFNLQAERYRPPIERD